MPEIYKFAFQLLPLSLFLLVLASCDQDGADRNRQFIPGAGFKADAVKGIQLFADNCAKCHGADIRGTLKGPPLLDTRYRPGHHGDMAFYRAVSKGVKQHHWHFGDMQPVRGLTGEDVADIISFVRLEQRKAGIK